MSHFGGESHHPHHDCLQVRYSWEQLECKLTCWALCEAERCVWVDVDPWLTCAEVLMSDTRAGSRPWRSTRYTVLTHHYLAALLADITDAPISLCHRARRPTGRAAPTWRPCRGSMGSLSRTQRCWRSGNAFRRRPRTETIARLAKWVSVGWCVQAPQRADAVWWPTGKGAAKHAANAGMMQKHIQTNMREKRCNHRNEAEARTFKPTKQTREKNAANSTGH